MGSFAVLSRAEINGSLEGNFVNEAPSFFWTLSREASPVVFLLYLHDAAAVL
jgi:hypothetical protein